MTKWLAGVALLCLSGSAEAGAAFRLPAEAMRAIVSGIDHVANLDYARARETFAPLTEMPGGDLLHPFLEGLVEIDEVVQEDRREEELTGVLDRFLARMEPVVARGEALVEAEPDNPDLLIAMGIMRGFTGVVDRTRNNYFDAYRGIRASHRHLTRVLEVAPHRVDALWPLGMYDYAVSRVPALLKPFVALVLPGGDRARGLERLRRAAHEGTFAAIPATVTLVRILSGWEEEFPQALPFAELLATRYPGNPEFLFLLAFLYAETQQTRRALAVAETIRSAINQTDSHFSPELLPRYLQLRGKIAMDAGSHQEALDFFQQAIEQRNAKFTWITAWAYTRTGMIYDLRGEREKAVASYQRALEVEARGLAHEMAERYLAEPYGGKARPPRE